MILLLCRKRSGQRFLHALPQHEFGWPHQEIGVLLRWQLLRQLAAVLGLRWEAEAESSLDDGAIDAAIAARKDAKASKNYSEADRIRDELAAQGVELIDKPGGVTEWIRA